MKYVVVFIVKKKITEEELKILKIIINQDIKLTNYYPGLLNNLSGISRIYWEMYIPFITG